MSAPTDPERRLREPREPEPTYRRASAATGRPSTEGETASIRNLLTIDVEDYFHASGFADRIDPSEWGSLQGRVEYTTRRLLRILGEHDVRATFFVLGWVADRYPSLVREIHDHGHEVASHGWWHRLAYEQAPDEFRDDVVRSRAYLQDLVGDEVLGYRAPSFSITARNRWALEVLAEVGYRYDASIYPIRRRRYGDPACPREIHRVLRPAWGHEGLWEVPGTTVRLAGLNVPVAGGGYLRAMPLALTRAAIRHLNRREERPATLYLHPWELDPHQPRLPASPGNRFRHYLNLDRTEERLVRLLEEFPFGPVREALPGIRHRSGDRRRSATLRPSDSHASPARPV